MTSCGGRLPSRAENLTLSLLSPASTKLYVPFPATRVETSYSTQVFFGMAPLLSTAPLVRAGRLLQVSPVSVQVLPVAYTAGPFFVASVVLYTRKRTLWIGPD